MEHSKIESGNEVIARFMGAKCTPVNHTKGNEDYLKTIGKKEWFIDTWSKPEGLPENVGWGVYQMGKFQYHTSWDWLKPVIDKIFLFALAHPEQVEPIRQMSIVVHITPAWRKCVEFITWYNTQPK